MSSVVYQEVSNDFKNNEQSINSRPIASVIYGPFPAPESPIKPDRLGLVYIQIKEGDPDKKTHMWVSVYNGPTLGYVWEELFAQGDIPGTVVRTDKVNDFQPYEQKISGKQIMSFVDGGSLTPDQSKLPADYDGQFYIAVRTLSTGNKDVSIWVASGNQWLPFAGGGAIDITRLAKLDVNNNFEGLQHFKESVFLEHNTNFIGELANGRQVVGCRVKNSPISPATDATWRPAMEGEICIFNNIGVQPNQLSIWIATNANSVGTSHWKQIYPSSGGGSGGAFTPPDFIDNYSEKESDIRSGIGSDGKITLNTGIDQNNLAHLDKSNLFVPFQRIGGGGNEAYITGARNGYMSPKGITVPVTTGEIYIRQIIGTNDYEIWVATQEGDTDSWVQIYDQVFSKYVGDKFEIIDGELDTFKSDIKLMEDDIEAAETKVDTFDARIKKAEDDILSLKSVDKTLNDAITELNNFKSDALAEFSAIDTQFDTERDGMNYVVNETATELRREFDKKLLTINTDLDSMAQTLGTIDSEVTGILNDISNLTRRIEALEAHHP